MNQLTENIRIQNIKDDCLVEVTRDDTVFMYRINDTISHHKIQHGNSTTLWGKTEYTIYPTGTIYSQGRYLGTEYVVKGYLPLSGERAYLYKIASDMSSKAVKLLQDPLVLCLSFATVAAVYFLRHKF
jgi:hypothetical protein